MFNGKSYQAKKTVIDNAYHNDRKFVYLRRYKADIKTKAVESYFEDMPISKMTKGEYDGVIAWNGIIDCVFYGKLFGYAGWFYGRVVDMFYFPLIHNSAGEVIFFRPVFNFADSCITCAVAVILLFYMKELNGKENSTNTAA